MRIVYISDDVNVVEISDEELKRINGDENYTPKIGDEVSITEAWNTWLWIKSKKNQINTAGTQLVALANKL